MEADMAVLADAANVSREGKLNVCGVFRTLHAASAPITWPPCVLVLELLLRGDERERPHSLLIRLIGPDDSLLREFPVMAFGGESTADAPQPHGDAAVAVPLTFQITNLVVPSFGLYRFEVLVDGEDAVSMEAEARPF